MILRFRVLGWEVFAMELERGEVVEEPTGITSGSSHNFERCPEPEVYYEEDRGFGFRVNTAPR